MLYKTYKGPKMVSDELIKKVNKVAKNEKYMYTHILSDLLPGAYNPDELYKKPWEEIVRQTAALIPDFGENKINPALRSIQTPAVINYIFKHWLGGGCYSDMGVHYYCVRDNDGIYTCKIGGIDKNCDVRTFLWKARPEKDECRLGSIVVNFAANGRYPLANPIFYYEDQPKIYLWNPINWNGKLVLNNGWTIAAFNVVPGVMKLLIPTDDPDAYRMCERLVTDNMTYATIAKYVDALPDYIMELARANNYKVKAPLHVVKER